MASMEQTNTVETKTTSDQQPPVSEPRGPLTQEPAPKPSTNAKAKYNALADIFLYIVPLWFFIFLITFTGICVWDDIFANMVKTQASISFARLLQKINFF